MQKLQDIQRAMELLSACQGPAKNIDEATKRKYQFWDTQPVPKLSEVITSHGAIEPDKDNIRVELYPLPLDFTWGILDLSTTEIAILWFLSTDNGHSVTKNSNINKKMFTLEVVGGVVFILLVLLCILLHYFRRKCLKPHQLFKKLRLSSKLRGAKKDRPTSVAYLSLVVSRSESEFSDSNRYSESSGNSEVAVADVHVNKGCAVGETDIRTPVLQHTYSTSQGFSLREESLSHKENDHSCMSLESVASFFIHSTKSLEKTEGYDSPDKEDHRQSFSARSLSEKEEQAKFQVELSSPYSQQQMHPQYLAAQAISQQHLQEAGTGDGKPQHIVMSESVSIPASLSDELLTKKGVREVDRRKPLLHPRAWFVSLDGHSNIVRHSYIDLQTDGRNRINNISLDHGNDMNVPKQKGQKDLDEVDQSGIECETALCSPEDNTPRCVFEGGRRRHGQLPSLPEETIKRSVESPSEPFPSTEDKITGDHEANCDGNDSDDGDHQSEGRKTPWQKREERPVIIFDLK